MIVCFGENTFAQLGIGDVKRDNPFTHLPFGASENNPLDSDTIDDVQCGSKFSVALDTSGGISVCGTVNGINYPILTAVRITYPLKCVQICCGRKHILALMEGGHVLSWGVGYFGQLGHGDDSSYDNAKLIQALEPNRLGSRVVHVACGGSHSGVVTESGKVFMWGLNKQGQCGLGSKQPESVTEPRPLDPEIMAGIKITSLVCGRNHSAIISSEGKVFTFGATSFGRLGTDRDGASGNSNSAKRTQNNPLEVRYFRNLPVHSLASGDFHMLALAHDCSVYSWGCGSDGQLGHIGSLDNCLTPRRIAFFGKTSKVVQIACGSGWSSAVTSNGIMYVWGQGDGGWLGIPPPKDLVTLGEGDPPIIPEGTISPSTSSSSSSSSSSSASSSSSSSSSLKVSTNALDSLIENDRSPIDKQQQQAEQSFLKHSCSFDSRHNVLAPVPINQYFLSSEYIVERMRCGGSHTVVFLGRKREDGSGSCLMDESGGEGMNSRNDGSKSISNDRDEINYSNRYNNNNSNNNSNNNQNNNSNSNNQNAINSHSHSHSHVTKLSGGTEDGRNVEKSSESSLLGSKRSSPTKSKI